MDSQSGVSVSGVQLVRRSTRFTVHGPAFIHHDVLTGDAAVRSPNEGQRMVTARRVALSRPKWTMEGICGRKLLMETAARTMDCPLATAVKQAIPSFLRAGSFEVVAAEAVLVHDRRAPPADEARVIWPCYESPATGGHAAINHSSR